MNSTGKTSNGLTVRIIANPVSGFGRGARLAEDLLRALRALGAVPSLIHTRAAGDARAEARRCARDVDVVACIGGDGTVNEVANGIKGSRARLAILPTGTANVLAKEFGIRDDLPAVSNTILAGKTVNLDVGRWKDRIFLCMSGVGFDAAVARRYAERRKGRGSFTDYLGPFVRTLAGFRSPGLEVTVDGKRVRGHVAWALATNTRSYGGPLWFCEEAVPTDGVLDLVFIRRPARSALPRYFLHALARRFERVRDAGHLTGTRFVIRPVRGRIPVQLDGDFAGFCTPDDPAVFELLPGAIQLMVP